MAFQEGPLSERARPLLSEERSLRAVPVGSKGGHLRVPGRPERLRRLPRLSQAAAARLRSHRPAGSYLWFQ